MIPKFKWSLISREYITYLANYDKNINSSNSPTPQMGIVTFINDAIYFLPVSAVKPKYLDMSERPDFIRLAENGNLIAAINLNNMFPIPREEIIPLRYEDIGNYFHFDNNSKMIALLKKELSLINNKRNEIVERANILYETKFDMPLSKVSERCCNFDMLEEKCVEYQRVKRILPMVKYINSKSNLYHIYDNISNQDDFEKIVYMLDNPVRSTTIKNMTRAELDEVLSRNLEDKKEY